SNEVRAGLPPIATIATWGDMTLRDSQLRSKTIRVCTEIPEDEPLEESIPFVRGDVDQNGAINLTDPIRSLQLLFHSVPATCLDAADANDDGNLNLTDPIYQLMQLFQAGPALPPPSLCGEDS